MPLEGTLRANVDLILGHAGSRRFQALKRVSRNSSSFLGFPSPAVESRGSRKSGSVAPDSISHHSESTSASYSLPNLPVEICRRIIGYAVRLAGSTMVNLDDPFNPDDCEDILGSADRQMLQDRRTHLSICHRWRAIALEIISEYISIFSEKQLRAVIELLESAKKKRRKSVRGTGYGVWTRRIDLHVSTKPYPAKQIVRLLRCAPKLQIFTVHDQHASDRPTLRKTDPAVIQALAECKSIRRLDWTSQETISWQDVATLSRNLPLLQSLRLFCLYSYEGIRTAVKTPPSFPSLKTLALGPIPMPTTPLSPPLSWDHFLTSLSLSPKQLPSLERLDIEAFPDHSCVFLLLYGEKIKYLRTTTYTLFESSRLRTYLPLFPNLQTLVVAHGSEFEFIAFPPTHATLERICITPLVEDRVEVPWRIFTHAVLTPLEGLMMILEDMHLSNLKQLRIRNTGAFSEVEEHGAWLQLWWRRWTLRGISFEDSSGNMFRTTKRDEDALLNLVRG